MISHVPVMKQSIVKGPPTVNHCRKISIGFNAQCPKKDRAAERWTYLCVVNLAGTKQRIHGIISWKKETGEIDEEGAGDVEEHKEEI